MDRWTSVAINIFLGAVGDEKQGKELRKAVFKVFREIVKHWGHNPEFQEYGKKAFTETEA